uniref:Peroxidase n=1 Tax=Zea mays TaxID=4577 RepID=A0A804PIA6_MAIZE
MARRLLAAVAIVVVAAALACGAGAQLSAGFYSSSCPAVHSIVRQAMSQAVTNNTRSAAAVLRVFFHDCFVNGCDASLLLDDTPTTPGEKGAGPNAGGSTVGFDLIDTIKAQVEAACPATVSCADILALTARDGVNLHGRGDGPPGPGLRPGRPGGRVRRQGPEPARPRGAVGRAHGGDGALRQLPHPRLLRRQREPGVRRAAAPGLPVGRRRRRARAARLAHPRPVRQRLLPEPHGRRRPAALGPGALQQRRTRLARAPLRHQRRRLLVGLRRVHGQARQHRPAHGFRGGGQAQLQDGEFEFVTSGRPDGQTALDSTAASVRGRTTADTTP